MLPAESLPLPGDLCLPPKREALRVIELLRLWPLGAVDDGDLGSMVCERATRLGTARGPPGTVGVLGICTGRGLGGALVGLFWSLAGGCCGISVLPRGTPDFMLALRPNDEKNPECDLIELGESGVITDEEEELVDTLELNVDGAKEG